MIKRLFDLACVIPGIVLLSPLFIIVAAGIKLDSSGPAIFRQKRVGRNGILFDVLKFRTMRHEQHLGEPKITVGGDQRITRFGAILRKLKLDEFPQLFNVLLGDMSLVGPRPEVPEYVEFYPAGSREKVLSVRPGITDLASLEFRNESEILANEIDPVTAYVEKIIPRKLAYYTQYIDEQSLWLDIRIILRTIMAVIRL